MRRSACALRLCREWHAGQPPMRASTCNEALCCALRSALCLGQPLARGVDVQLMRRSAFAAPRVRELAWGSKVSEACVLRSLLQTHGGWDECCVSPRGRLERPKLAEQLDKRGYSRPLTARREIYKQLRLSQDC